MQPSTEYLPSLLKASWQGAVLILLVLAVQRIFGRRLSPRWRYLLWMLVMIRLALPWTIPSSVSLFNLLNFSASASDGMHPAPISPGPAQPTVVAPTKQANATVTLRPAATSSRSGLGFSWLLGVWVTGASALAVYLLATHRRLSKRVAKFRPLVNTPVLNLLEDCKQQMGVRVPITLVETTEVGSPALFGFIRPRLLLPAGMTQSFSLDELRYVFLHELSHIKRHDILVGWLMTGLQILHWFNPLVWLAFYRMRVDRELACDALALSYARADENQPYGRTIIKLLESFGRSTWAPSLAGAVENKNQMKERITMIAKFEKTNRGLALAMVLFASLGLVTLTDAQSRSETSQLAKDLIGTWVWAGTPGEVGEAPAAGGRVKVVTDSKWSLTQTDAKTGKTNYYHGGTWAIKGDEYAEAVEYANANTTNLINRTFKFNIKVEGDTLTLIGLGNPWKEVWKRVKSEALSPLKPDSIPQGKWVESESGGSAQKDDSKMNEEVKLRMIVLNKQASGDAAAQRNLAEQIASKIKKGASFSEMAGIYSQGSQRSQGGDWGWIKPGVLRKHLAEVAFSLKPGETSGIIETPEAIYLMLVEDKRPALPQASLVLKGSNLEFHGADPGEWYKGTFSVYDTTPKQLVVLITDCPMPQYVGKTAYAIYQLENGTLTVTGNEPGNPTVPAGFDASGARKLVFNKE